jgi:hypothetical protein
MGCAVKSPCSELGVANEVKLPGVEIWRMSDAKAKRVQTPTDTAEMEKALRR